MTPARRTAIPSSAAGQDGFVLPLVLVTVAIVALALWSAVSVLDVATRNVRDLRENLALEVAAASVEARLGYVVAVEPIGANALRVGGMRITREQMMGFVPVNEANFRRRPSMEVVLDGRPYRLPQTPDWPQRVPEGLVISLQDRAGLVNLNSLDEQMLERALRVLGVDQRRSRSLAARLADFTDTDIFRRLEGAEKDVYERVGLPPPPDAPMRRASEAFGVLGWAEELTAEQRAILEQNSYAGPRFSQMNVNTARPDALKAWFDLDDTQTRQALRMREVEPFLSIFDFNAIVGSNAPFNELNSYTRPADTLRMTIERGGPRCRMRQVWVTHAQVGASQPLFFSNRQDMSCPPVVRGLEPDPIEPITIPVSGSRAVEGNGGVDSSRR